MDEYSNEYCSIDNVINKLKEDGIGVIPNIITEENIIKYQNEMWSMLNKLTDKLDKPIDKNNKDTWNTFFELFPLYDMILHQWNISHSKLCWDIRQENNVLDVFSKIWNVKKDELLTSFDGMSIHLPPEITKRNYKNDNWCHTDQSRLKKDFCCVQGMVTLYDINEGDSTLMCYKKSNNYHSDFFKEHNEIKTTADWYKVKDNELKYFKKFKRIRIKAKKGSLILWDSRTFHQGTQPLQERYKPNLRSVIYVCMTPREWSNEKELKKKRKAYRTKRTTSHWPHKIWLFSKKPKTNGLPILNITPINEEFTLNNIGFKIAGF